MLAAGLDGIENNYELPPSVEPNIYKLSADEREAIGLGSLPDNLFQAVQETQQSELVRRTLGDHVFERFITNKLNEWYQYREQVTSYEIERYLSVL
jgi:glutamine synthetase